MEEKSTLINWTGMWAHETRSQVYSAKLPTGTLWLRRNYDSQSDKDPDWWLSFNQKKGVIVNLVGLYDNESKAGKAFLAGNWGGLRVVCFFLDKKTDKHPDVSVCLSQRESRGDR